MFFWHWVCSQLPRHFPVDLLPGQTFDSLGAAEDAMRSYSREAALLERKGATSDDSQTKYFYSVPSIPATYGLIYVPPYYTHSAISWEVLSADSAQGVIDLWWATMKRAFGDIFLTYTYRPGPYNGVNWIGTLWVEWAGKPLMIDGVSVHYAYYSYSCPTDYDWRLYRAECHIYLTAVITQTVTATCPIPDLTEPTDAESQALEANPIDTDHLTEKTKEGLRCLVGKIKDEYKVNANLTSAFRTEAYQRHLYEIYDRWIERGLIDDTSPECAELKQKVGDEWNRHGLEGLKTSPAQSAGKHPQGLAFDLSRRSTISQLEAKNVDIGRMAGECGLSYPMPVRDRGHFELR